MYMPVIRIASSWKHTGKRWYKPNIFGQLVVMLEYKSQQGVIHPDGEIEWLNQYKTRWSAAKVTDLDLVYSSEVIKHDS